MNFCKDCRNYVDGEMWCFIPNGHKRTPIRFEKAYRNFDPLNHNKNNDCGDYRRKWWKLWIQGGRP